MVKAAIRVSEGVAAPTRYCDVVVTHPVRWERTRWRGTLGGKAAASAESDKHTGYKPAAGGRAVLLTPLAFETFGRWGHAAAAEVRRLARCRARLPMARRAVDPSSIYRATLLRWRRELSARLQQGNALVLLGATGKPAELSTHAAPLTEALDFLPEAH